MNFLKKLFTNHLPTVLILVVFIFMVLGMNADMFLHAVIGLLAIIAGILFAFDGLVKKGISFAIFLGLLFFATMITEPRLSDLIVMSVWFPFCSALIGATVMRMFSGKKAEVEQSNDG